MILKMFTVYDSKAEAFLQPFYAQTTGVAIRIFTAAANDAGHDFNRYAGDYSLFEIGEFDQQSGTLYPLEAQENLGLAITYITEPKTMPALAAVPVMGGE